MKLRIFQIDAFANGPFGGNPAAVVPLDDWISEDQMQAIAAENNLAETAYFVAEGDRFGLRWFTPVKEVDLCGHATLASAYVLFHYLGQTGDTITFNSASGPLAVRRSGDLLSLDFPAEPPEPHTDSGEVEAALALPAGALRELARGRYYLARLNSEQAVRELRPDMAALEALDRVGVMATAPGENVDFVYRFFAPAAGIPEDPATGSAQCALLPFWSQRLGKKVLRSHQVSSRLGVFEGEDRGERVTISGQCVPYLIGEITI